MNLLPRSQIFDLDSLFDSAFNDFYPGFGRSSRSATTQDSLAGMRVDVHETDKAYEIHADLPGVKKADIDVTLVDDILTVSASKNTESTEQENGKVIWRERSSGAISRSFSVSPGTREKDIKARFQDGVLTLAVPKKAAEESNAQRKRIAID